MPNTVHLCAAEEVKEGALKRVTVGDVDVVVTRVDARLYALEDRCTHMSVPFSLGTLEGRVLTCAQHQGQFDITTGAILRIPDVPSPEQNLRAHRSQSLIRTHPLKHFPVEERGGQVYVKLP